MHFENYTHDDTFGRHTFDAVGVDLAILNALRRLILTDVPTVGFRGEASAAGEPPSVEVLLNDGPLHNEIMQHRIGLLPVHFSEREVDAFNPATDGLTFELDVTNHGNGLLDVTTRDIVAKRAGEATAEAARLFPNDPVTHDAVLITSLRPGETLRFVATPVKSTPREHAGFTAVSQCTYTFLGDEAAHGDKGPLERERAYKRNAYGDPTHVQFRLEVENGLSVRYLVDKAFELLAAKVQRARRGLDEADETVVTQAVGARPEVGSDFTFHQEDDTLGNVLQSLIHNDQVREPLVPGAAPDVRFVGYFCPHPLEETVVLRVVPAEKGGDARGALLQQLERIHRHVEDLRAEWSEFAPKAR